MVNIKDNTAGFGFTLGTFGAHTEVKDYAETLTTKSNVVEDIKFKDKIDDYVKDHIDIESKIGENLKIDTKGLSKSLTKGLSPVGLIGDAKSGLTRSINGLADCVDLDFDIGAFNLSNMFSFGLGDISIDCDLIDGPVSYVSGILKDSSSFIKKTTYELSQMSDVAVVDYQNNLAEWLSGKETRDSNAIKILGMGIPNYLKNKDKITEYDLTDLQNNPDLLTEIGKRDKTFSNALLRSTDFKNKSSSYEQVNDVLFQVNGKNDDNERIINLAKNQGYRDLGINSLKNYTPTVNVISEPSIEAMVV